MGEPYLWRRANVSPKTCVVVKQMQSKSNYMSVIVFGNISYDGNKTTVTKPLDLTEDNSTIV